MLLLGIILLSPKLRGPLKNLLLYKHSLVTKNIFKYIKHDDAIWFDILNFKYGMLNFWRDLIPSYYSWVFRGLCFFATNLKPFYWINLVNPSRTFLLFDQQCYEVPLALNPTFLNMSLPFEFFKVSDFILDGNWGTQRLRYIFGDNLDWFTSRLSSIDSIADNHWVWFPQVSK